MMTPLQCCVCSYMLSGFHCDFNCSLCLPILYWHAATVLQLMQPSIKTNGRPLLSWLQANKDHLLPLPHCFATVTFLLLSQSFMSLTVTVQFVNKWFPICLLEDPSHWLCMSSEDNFIRNSICSSIALSLIVKVASGRHSPFDLRIQIYWFFPLLVLCFNKLNCDS